MAVSLQYYLALDEVSGGSQRFLWPGFFAVSDFVFSAIRQSIGGQPSFEPLQVALPVNQGVTAFLDLAATGRLTESGRLVGVDFLGNIFLDLRLRDIAVTTVVAGVAGSEVALTFDAFTLATRTILPGDIPGPIQFSGFDLDTNTSLEEPLEPVEPGAPRDPDRPVSFRLVVDGVAAVFALSDFVFEVEAPSGASAAAFSALDVVLPSGGVGADLIGLLASGAVVEHARLEGLNSVGITVYDLRLSDVAVVGLNDTTGGDRITLDFDAYSLTTRLTDARTTDTVGFDTVANSALAAPLALAVASNGDDTVFSDADTGALRAGAGDDFVVGDAFRDWMFGGGGNDVLLGNAGRDTLNGSAGADVLLGGDDDDSLLGRSGADFLAGGAEDDTLDGGRGNDTLRGGINDFDSAGLDLYIAGDGIDLVTDIVFRADRFSDTLQIDFFFEAGPQASALNAARTMDSVADLIAFVGLLSNNGRRTAAEIDGMTSDLILVLDRGPDDTIARDAVILDRLASGNQFLRADLIAAGADLI